MPRPSRAHERRRELIPIVAAVFAEYGYRRATTAELASRCEVQENVLYRLWPDKRAMFVASIEYVYDLSMQLWEKLLAGDASDPRSAAERLLDYESEHHGEFGLYRIIYAGLGETDDEEIRSALARMYERYQAFIERRVVEHRGGDGGGDPSVGVVAWAMIGLGTVSSMGRELGVLGDAERRQLWHGVGQRLLGSRRT